MYSLRMRCLLILLAFVGGPAAARAHTASSCAELLVAAEAFPDPSAIPARFPKIGFGRFGILYRVEYAPGAYVTAKVYHDPQRAIDDQRSLDDLRTRALATDPVQVLPSIVSGAVMWLRYVDARDLNEVILSIPRADPARLQILKAYRRYLKTEIRRQRALFGPAVRVSFHRSLVETYATHALWWLSSERPAGPGDSSAPLRFSPHAGNVLVERASERLWLTDPH